MSNRPQFAAVPLLGLVQVSVANTNRDGSTGTYATCMTATGAGTKIEKVVLQAVGTTTAGIVRLFLYNGTNARLFDEFLVTAITPSGTVSPYRTKRYYDNLTLPASWQLRANTHNAETFNLFTFGGTL